ncbi:MAG: type II toxin-antitoxin system death-on-curing family toxin [Clostridia bacterium]|nr:type II toxin-antitoxin system death-on-curing family toxin [Clostridia bacterium]MDO4852233.1 type II toxin-antitoxin system death-on-curing family toxin [Clostridia bacterium]
MIKFSQEKVLLLHQLITEETGGDNGVRDYGLLDSALESVYQTFDGKELYPTKQEKGARLGYTLISNHAFVDGNKRIGMYVMLAFLQVNGIHIHPTNEEVARVGIAVAAGEMGYEELLEWVKTNTDNLK